MDESRDATSRYLDQETIDWMLRQSDDELVKILFTAGQIASEQYWRLLMPVLRGRKALPSAGGAITHCADGQRCANKTTGRCWGRCMKESIIASSPIERQVTVETFCAKCAKEIRGVQDVGAQRASIVSSAAAGIDATGRLSDHPASPLPWRLQDAVIFDANGESILGEVEGQPVEFPSEFDADYIFQAVQHFSQFARSTVEGNSETPESPQGEHASHAAGQADQRADCGRRSLSERKADGDQRSLTVGKGPAHSDGSNSAANLSPTMSATPDESNRQQFVPSSRAVASPHLIADQATEGQKHAAFEWLRSIATDENRTPAIRKLAAIAQDEWHRCREIAQSAIGSSDAKDAERYRVVRQVRDWSMNMKDAKTPEQFDAAVDAKERL